MSLYPEQKKLIDEIFVKLKQGGAPAAEGLIDMQIHLLIQQMLTANALEVIAENMRAIRREMT
jgi:hypothetical protein